MEQEQSLKLFIPRQVMQLLSKTKLNCDNKRLKYNQQYDNSSESSNTLYDSANESYSTEYESAKEYQQEYDSDEDENKSEDPLFILETDPNKIKSIQKIPFLTWIFDPYDVDLNGEPPLFKSEL